MSAIGAALARGLAAIGGPGPAAALIAGGVVVGALGGGFMAANGSQTVSASDELAVYACPGTGSPLVSVPAGQKMLATGRTEDSTWLRIHNPDPTRPEAWVFAELLVPSGSIAGLPVSTCMAELAVAAPLIEPQSTFTPQEANSPTPGPTAGPTPTPTPRVTARPNSRPDLGSLTASPRRISFDTGDFCPNAETTATFRVRAEDDEGIQSVALFWREPGAGSFARLGMTRAGGSARDATWQAALDTQANGINRAGSLAYFAVATDTDGATRRLPNNGSSAITVEVCRNEGPDITQVRSSGGSPLFEDPFGVSRCQTATNITAVVRDPQGVDSVRLFYRRPGDSGYQSKAMDLRRGSWFANLDTLGDKISISNPPTGTLRWYIRATDDEGADTQIDPRLVTIRRCDTEATIFVNALRNQYSYGCPSPNFRLQWSFSIDDADSLQRITLQYRMVGQQGEVRTQTIRQSVSNGRFSIESREYSGDAFSGQNEVTWTITTQDRYDGTTRENSKGVANVFIC